MSLIMWVSLIFVAVGLTMIFWRKAGAADYVRRYPGTAATEEQIQQVYLVLGSLLSGGALLVLAAILLST